MKRIFLLVFLFAAISSSAFAALIQVKLTVATTNALGEIRVAKGGVNQNTQLLICQGTTPCAVTFRSGDVVTLTAFSFNSATAAFNGWGPVSGSATPCGGQATCSFTITQDSKATAKFLQVFNLRVQVGTGSGTIRVKDHGVTQFDCTNTAPLSCSRGFFIDSAVTIENIAGPNQQFGSYSSKTGSMTACTSNPCSFTLKADSSLVSNFIQIP